MWKEFQIGMPFERIFSDGCLRKDGNFISLDYIFKILKRIVFIQNDIFYFVSFIYVSVILINL